MKIQILYFSAVGSTKEIAKMMANSLSTHETHLQSIEEDHSKDFSSFQAVIIGTPTHHAAPTQRLMSYIDELPVQKHAIPTFVFNTKGLAACNTNRILAKKLHTKNFITIFEADYRAPASDGALLIPSFNRFFEFEKEVESKVKQDCQAFIKLLQTDKAFVTNSPHFRLSSIINAPNKFGSRLFKLQIKTHAEACSKCHLCSKHCPYQAFTISEHGIPYVVKKKCTNCYRCIHRCPNRALSLFKKAKHKSVLNY